MKFSALNVDFDCPCLDFLGSSKPAHEGIKERYPRKSRYFSDVGQSFVKTVADKHGHGVGPQHTSTDSPNRPKSLHRRNWSRKPLSFIAQQVLANS